VKKGVGEGGHLGIGWEDEWFTVDEET